jgi:hypothetical protein|nr:MAG TPA: hypothetical protein [Caudoviricetes sp.]
MADIVNINFKMKRDEMSATHIAASDTKRKMVEMLDKDEGDGIPTHEAIKRGIKGLDRFINELELYLEV